MTAPLDEFASAAAEYLAWIEAGGASGQDRTAHDIRSHLSRLYAMGLRLVEPDGIEDADVEGRSYDAWRSLIGKLDVPFQYYYAALDPLADEAEFGTHDLLDDLADITRDLEEGLLYMRVGAPRCAQHHWASLFFHWGEHATQAIAALHQWAHRG